MISHKVDSGTLASKASRTTNAVDIVLSVQGNS